MKAEREAIDDARAPEPAAADVPEWKQLIQARLWSLCVEHFEATTTPMRRVSQLGREIQDLATIREWFEAGGNITRAAERLGTSRKVVRECVVKWRRSHPHLAPSPSPVPRRAAAESEPAVPEGEAYHS